MLPISKKIWFNLHYIKGCYNNHASTFITLGRPMSDFKWPKLNMRPTTTIIVFFVVVVVITNKQTIIIIKNKWKNKRRTKLLNLKIHQRICISWSLNTLSNLPSCVDYPEWVIKIAFVWIVLQCKESPITEPQPSLKVISNNQLHHNKQTKKV